MPNPIIMSVAKETGKSVKDVEDLWDKAKDIVSREYGDVDSDVDSDRFYSLVTGVIKKMTGYGESLGRANRILEAMAAKPQDWDEWEVPEQAGYFYLSSGTDPEEKEYLLDLGRNEGFFVTQYEDGALGVPSKVFDFAGSYGMKYGNPKELKLPEVPSDVAVRLLDAAIKEFQHRNQKEVRRSGRASTLYLKFIDYLRNVKKQVKG